MTLPLWKRPRPWLPRSKLASYQKFTVSRASRGVQNVVRMCARALLNFLTWKHRQDGGNAFLPLPDALSVKYLKGETIHISIFLSGKATLRRGRWVRIVYVRDVHGQIYHSF